MRQIYFDLGGIPTIFIRYNPDGYTDHEGKKHRTNQTRERVLLSFLRSFNNLETVDTTITIYYLFFDKWNGIPKKFTLEPYTNVITK